jgi:nicotinamide phosphoribosyltransferase
MKQKINTILLADAYKYTHYLQLPPKTTKICSYIESRGTKTNINYTKFFGLQGFIRDYLEGVVIEEWMVIEAEELLGEVFGTHEYFNAKGFRQIISKHGGKLPLIIRALPEGAKVPLSNALVVVENTDDDMPWLTAWIETMLLRAVWYPKNVCTISSAVKDIERTYAKICGCSENPFFLCDFGARGVSSHESSEIGGAAHLVNYDGSDNVEGIRWAKHNYGDSAKGYSVFATEHHTTTIYTKDGEEKAYKHFLAVAPKDKIVSIVIDSYDPENAVKNLLGGSLKQMILKREAPTVFRPDSGDPISMSLEVVSWLWEIFGGHINEKGFKCLNPLVKVLQGDGVNLHSIELILENLVKHDFSIENIFFGMGGKLLQGVDRDTFQDACKASFAIVDGQPVEIFKDPVSDKTKKSKKGLLKVVVDNGEYKTVSIHDFKHMPDEMCEVYRDGCLKKLYSMDQIRNR